MVLLIDERPEEVTEMQRLVKVKLLLLPLTNPHLATFRLRNGDREGKTPG